MDRVFTKSEAARMLKVDREVVIRLQAGGRLDRVSTSTIANGVSAGSLKAYISGGVAEFNRMLRSGTPRGR